MSPQKMLFMRVISPVPTLRSAPIWATHRILRHTPTLRKSGRMLAARAFSSTYAHEDDKMARYLIDMSWFRTEKVLSDAGVNIARYRDLVSPLYLEAFQMLLEKSKLKEEMLKAKEEKFEGILKANEEKLDQILKAKEESLKANEQVIISERKAANLMEVDLARTKKELASEKAKYEAMCTMRSVIEGSLIDIPDEFFRSEGKSKSGRISMSDRVKTFVNKELFESQGQLKHHVHQWIVSLEGNDSSRITSVKSELQDLYHELSKPIHHPRGVNLIGFVCGGPFPLRTAVAVTLLALQKGNYLDWEIIYADEQYEVRKNLREGEVVTRE